ncbi:MAG: toxic anion resistance protein [Acidimicrobiales bacterium]
MSQHNERTTGAGAPRLMIEVSEPSLIPPDLMSSDEVELARARAADLVQGVRDATGSRQLAVLDEVSSVGLEAQRNAGRQLELVKTRLATFLDEDGASKAIATELIDLRGALDRINPDVERRSLWARTVGALPFMRDSAMVRALRRIAVRYEPVSKQVTVIEVKLRQGRTMLARDNIELRRLYEDVESQQEAIQRQGYLGALLLHELTSVLVETSDPLERDRIQAAVHDVATRLQDLHAMQEVHLQYFVSIELTRNNNSRLGQAVDRTLTLATNVVTVGLAIQAALVRQQRVKEATARTREFLGEMIVQNAQAIRAQTDEIGDLYNEPVIAMDKLVQAHHDLVAALDAASRLREDGTATARRNIVELTSLTRELGEKVQGLEDETETRR